MNTDVFIVDGRAYSWRQLCELRRQQLEAARKAKGTQPALFELKDDHRPASEHTASGRYSQPSLLDAIPPPGGRPHDSRSADAN